MKKTTTKSKGLVIGCIIAALILTAIVVAVLLCRGEDPQPTVPTTQATVPTTQGTQPSQTNPTTNPTNPTEPTTQPTEPTVPTEPPHKHEYSAEVVAPTCAESGYTVYTCQCGDTYTGDKVPATGHTYTEEVVEPTCEAGGYTTFTCSCGDTYPGNEVPAPGHAWSEWETVQEPTEELDGKRQRTCSRCEAVEEGAIAKLPPSHKHSYTTVVTEPTCISGGCTTYTCECGDTYQADEVPALGHSFTEYKSNDNATCMLDGTATAECDRGCGEKHTVPDEGSSLGCDYEAVETKPTCTSGGYTTYTCTRCGDSYVGDKVAALGHDFAQYVSDGNATCETDGTKTAKCSRCEETDTVADSGSAKGHSYGQWITVKEPTEEAEGKQERACANCDAKEAQSIPKLNHVHNYTSEVTAPTCAASGYTTYTCTCGDTYTAEETAALGHDFAQYVSDGNATCETDGTKTAKCSRCDATDTVADSGSAKGHNFGEWITVKDPTEEAEGKAERTCANCSAKEEKSIPKLNHEHKHNAVVTDPTCTEGGYTTYTCACGDTYTAEETAALGHDFAQYVSDENATCEANGTKTAKCSRCDATDTVADSGSAKGHSYGKWTTTKEAACTEAGEQEKTCAACGDQQSQSVKALGHDYKAVVTAPTCVDSGYTTHTCTRCNDSYQDTEVSAKGHTWGEWITVEFPTETEEGKQERTCTACGAKEEKAIDKLDHQHAYTAKIVAATCTEQGYTKYSCSCGDSYKEDYIPALGHSYVKTVTAPTCTEDGYSTYTCSACGDSYTDNKVAATGHTYGDWTVVKQPTCLETGEEHSTCASCGAYESRSVNALSGMHTETWATVTASTLNIRSGPGTGYSKLGTVTKGDSFRLLQTYDYNGDWGLIDHPDYEEAWIRLDGYARVEDISVPNGHVWTDWQMEEGFVCGAGGKKYRTCNHCDAREEQTVGGEHRYTNWFTTPATCTEDGSRYRTCFICGYRVEETLPAGHDWPDVWKRDGNKRSQTCRVCEEVLVVVIPEGHTHNWTYEDHSITCEGNAYTLQTCSDCGLYFKNITAYAEGHTWTEWEVTRAATKEDVGYKQRTCTTCGEIFVFGTPRLDEDGNEFQQFIDPRIKITTNSAGGKTTHHYNYGRDGAFLAVHDYRTWGSEYVSIYIIEDGSAWDGFFRVVFYDIAGERQERIIGYPEEGWTRSLNFTEDGKFHVDLVGGY